MQAPRAGQQWPAFFFRVGHPDLKYPLRMRTLDTIDYSEAKRAVDLIVEEASKSQKAAAIAVADSHGDLICFARMDGAPVSSIQIAMNKAWTAARERKPTKEVGEKVRHPEKGHDIAYYGDPRYVGWGGGIPVLSNGKVVGAVAVSGLSSNEDVALATLGVELISRG
jgi:glc operon protein GlcG